jgi:class III lanthionine synthetase
MPSRQNFLYRLLDKDYHETFDAYMPRKTDFYDLMASMLPQDWQIQRKGIWFHCGSPQNVTPLQGWKIHVSATPANAHEVLCRVAALLLRRADTDFKFALDMSILFLLNSKNWPRGGSGKFITIYPRDNNRFLELIEEIHQSTMDLNGPYILSDHRYKESRVVFYRYGGMRLYDVLNVKGERTPVLIAPDGSHFQDERGPYPVTPPWVSTIVPVDEPQETSEQSNCLKQGRYEVQDVLGFSNAGGVYCALDRKTGKRVVIKEARPCVNPMAHGHDARELLKKEYRLLSLIERTGLAPKPIDLFEEWEHWFLVEEYIQGLPLACHSAEHNVLLRTRASEEDYGRWQETFLSVCAGLFTALDTLHRHNIVFADLSTSNILVEEATGKLKLIDFEGAWQPGKDQPGVLYTPGFVSQKRLAGGEAAMEDDYYAAGAVLMAYLFPVTGFFHLNPQASREMMANLRRDARFPQPVADMILALMEPEAARRPRPAEAFQIAAACASIPPAQPEPRDCMHDYRAVVEGIHTHLNDVASFARQDRLFPADQKQFTTNPLSLAWGAGGVGFALSRISGTPREDIGDWILGHKITPESYAPGLYAGLSGIAWCLSEMGQGKEAEKVFQNTFHHPLLTHSTDMFYGIAGWGLTCLRFFATTGDQLYLEKAILAGKHLLETSQESHGLCHWGQKDRTPIGFAHGASGIACFLLYLYLATGQEQFLVTGQRGLEFDLKQAVTTKDGGLSWRDSAPGKSPLYPYWQHGSAGIGMSVLRYWRLLGNPEYRTILEKIFVDTDRKYAVFPGKFMGLAGLGDFLLDMYELAPEARFLRSAHKAAEGIMQFQVERRGIAFPGDCISRLSCSYGNGSAGIALFLNRLLGEKGNPFMLDCLFRAREQKSVDVKTGVHAGAIASKK